jgi:hypothetical protein
VSSTKRNVVLVNIINNSSELILIDLYSDLNNEVNNDTLNIINKLTFYRKNSIINTNSSNNKNLRTKTIENFNIRDIDMSNDNELIACIAFKTVTSKGIVIKKCYIVIISFKTIEILSQIPILINNNSNSEDQERIVSTVEQISFFPNDNKRILVIGFKLTKIYMFSRGSLKFLHNIHCDIDLASHNWFTTTFTNTTDKKKTENIVNNQVICADQCFNIFSIDPKKKLIKNEILSFNNNRNDSMDELVKCKQRIRFPSLNRTSIPLIYSTPFSSNNAVNDEKINDKSTQDSIIVCGCNGIFICKNGGKFIIYYKKTLTNFKMIYKFALSKSVTNDTNNNINDTERDIELIIGFCINQVETILIAVSNQKNIYYLNLMSDIFKDKAMITTGSTIELNPVLGNFSLHFNSIISEYFYIFF